MIVQIIETNTSKIAAEIPIELAGQNYIPSEPEFFETAWRCAVEDKSVDAARREDYSFKVVRAG
jgi:hypothetical protein